jgi:hypothetical protein
VYDDGLSMVCDVFACRVHKAAGTFGALADSINCAEFHNLDVYRLNICEVAGGRVWGGGVVVCRTWVPCCIPCRQHYQAAPRGLRGC